MEPIPIEYSRGEPKFTSTKVDTECTLLDFWSERDIDLLLLEELNVSNEFSAWFYSRVTQSHETVSIKGAWHSISDPI